MKVLVTGAKGFVGRNLCEALKNIRDGKDKTRGCKVCEIFEYDIDCDEKLLDEYCKKADFVINLAGVNRPQNESEFLEGNFGFGEKLLNILKKYNNKCPVMLSSSTQATLDNPYGKSKKAGEDLFFSYANETGAKVLVYRFTNVFGKWARPNYNSAVATFCNNIANDLPITVNDENTELELLYIDDLIEEMLLCLMAKEHRVGKFSRYCEVPVTHKVTLGEIVKLLESFKAFPETLMMPSIEKDSFSYKLYSTYISHLPADKAIHGYNTKSDSRGSFTEIMKSADKGQFSINVSLPGETKGNHWHHSKWEIFLVVSGKALIKMRKIGSEETAEYEVSGDRLQAVYMLPGYTHSIKNLSETENLVTLMWANEPFDESKPDTFFEEV